VIAYTDELFGEVSPPRNYPGKQPDDRAVAHHQDLFLQPFGFQLIRQFRVAEHQRRAHWGRKLDGRWHLLVAFRLYALRYKQLLAGVHERMLVCYCCELRMACSPRGCRCKSDYCLNCLRCVSHCQCQVRKGGVRINDAAGTVSFRVDRTRRGHSYSADGERDERGYGKTGRRRAESKITKRGTSMNGRKQTAEDTGQGIEEINNEHQPDPVNDPD
jgi:hypothetical protein